MITRFWLTLLVRTFGYALVLTALIFLFVSFGPILQTETAYRLKPLRYNIPFFTPKIEESQKVTFADLLKQTPDLPPLFAVPVSTDSGLMIEKIEANSVVVANVDPTKEKEYMEALKQGIAHARGTVLPGETGNSYLFAHSTDAPWNISRYNAVFYLLRELERGDRITTFNQKKRIDWEVYDKKIVEPKDVEYLIAKYDKPVLTLQTCWPPGTTLKRLIILAKPISN